jgi:hypothetical protein
MAADQTDQHIRTYGGSVDAASVVFMHSVVDGALTDLCRATALVAPDAWYPMVDNHEEQLGSVRRRGYDVVAGERVRTLAAAVSFESLIKKTDRLFQVCRPDEKYTRAGYKFDRVRLVGLDELRHDIIHRNRRRVPIDGVEAGVAFLHETGLFFLGMVNHRFDLRIDPAYVKQRDGI